MKFLRSRAVRNPATETEVLSEYRRSGNLELLGSLYQNYMPLVYGLCLKYLRDEEQSKDAVMQIFEQLIQKLKVHQVSNFKSWLYTLARNYCLMALRSSNRYDFINIDEYDVEKGSFQHPEMEYDMESELKSMSSCMEKLPPEQRISVDLFYLQRKCYKEIAELTGYDLNKVKSYIQNAKRNLKICMEKNSGKVK